MKTELLRAITAGILLIGLGADTARAQTTLPADTCALVQGVRTCELWARPGSVSLPGSTTPIAIWGYTTSAAGTPTVPGPALIVHQGESVVVILHNDLPLPTPPATRNTSLHFQGQEFVPDTTGVAPGGTATYAFTASRPGTFLYEAASLLNAQHQVAMGLHGALIVRPAQPSQAYGDATSAFYDEALVVLSEIDPALNNLAEPSGFDMRNYAPRFFLLNGAAHPGTASIPASASSATAANKLLLRYANGSVSPHSMALLGTTQSVIAVGGNPMPFPRRVVAESLAPGETLDALVTIPETTASGTRLALYDANLSLHNSSSAGMGGMLTFLTVGTPTVPGSDLAGPGTSGVALSPNPTNGSGAGTVSLTATVSDAATGGNNVTAAEFFVDLVGANGSGTALPVASPSPTVAVSGTVAASALASGNHTVYVRGLDALGNWGPTNFAILNVDKTGPITVASLAPNPSNGGVDVILAATANDQSTGNGKISAGEYFIGAAGATGSGTPLTFDGSTPADTAPIASLTATISAATVNLLPAGDSLVSVRSRDVLGNWGALATVTLTIDKAGPVVATLSAAPNPNNGTLGLNANSAVVRVTATLTDDRSSIGTAEGFLDPTGTPATGTGFPLVPNGTAGWYADIPLSTIAQLTNGPHTISVRGKDSAGNWGSLLSTPLVIDKQAPGVSGIVLVPPASNSSAVSVSASATDAATGGSNVTGGEFFVDTAGPAGSGTAMTAAAPAPSTTIAGTIPAAVVAALTTGNHAVLVRARDSAGNWGGTASTTLLVDRTTPTFSGISLAPSVALAGSTVTLTVNGATDPLVGGLASGVAGGEYWFGTNNPPPGGGNAFTGLTTSITAPPNNGTYIVRARIRDVAGNWSTGTGGVRSATLTVAPDLIFSNGFELGTSGWTSVNGTVAVNAAAALVGSSGMAAAGNGSNYVASTVSPVAATYDARFRFRPNGNLGNNQDIFAASTGTNNFNNNRLFRVRYRWNGGSPQVQIQLGGGTGNASWTSINGSTSNSLEVVWQAAGSGGPGAGSLQLHVNGFLSQTLTTTSTQSVGAVRLGSVTSGGSSIVEHFDAFASKRSVSPLFGP